MKSLNKSLRINFGPVWVIKHITETATVTREVAHAGVPSYSALCNFWVLDGFHEAHPP